LRFMRVSLSVLLLAVVFVAVFSAPSVVRAQQNDAISSAQNTLAQCYDAARAAESAGANISQLTSRLNSAGLLLSRAELANSVGDFGSANSLAAQSQSELASFVSDAVSLQSSAERSRSFEFLLNVVGSVAGTIAVLVGSFVIWVLLKRRYGTSGVQTIESDAV
jgi:hypothetical protein